MTAPDPDRSRSILEAATRRGRALAMRMARALDSLPPSQRGAVFLVLLGLLVVQLAGIVQLGRTNPAVSLDPVSREPRVEPGLTPGTYAIVSFSGEARMGAIASLLEARGVEIVEGPKAGIWRVRLSRAPLDAATVQGQLEALKGDGRIVVFAAPAL